MSFIEDINWPIHHTKVGPIAAYPLGWVEPPNLDFMREEKVDEDPKFVRKQILDNAKSYVAWGIRNRYLVRPGEYAKFEQKAKDTSNPNPTADDTFSKVIESLSKENLKLNNQISNRDAKIKSLQSQLRKQEEECDVFWQREMNDLIQKMGNTEFGRREQLLKDKIEEFKKLDKFWVDALFNCLSLFEGMGRFDICNQIAKQMGSMMPRSIRARESV
jgi:hypothetical protein